MKDGLAARQRPRAGFCDLQAGSTPLAAQDLGGPSASRGPVSVGTPLSNLSPAEILAEGYDYSCGLAYQASLRGSGPRRLLTGPDADAGTDPGTDGTHGSDRADADALPVLPCMRREHPARTGTVCPACAPAPGRPLHHVRMPSVRAHGGACVSADRPRGDHLPREGQLTSSRAGAADHLECLRHRARPVLAPQEGGLAIVRGAEERSRRHDDPTGDLQLSETPSVETDQAAREASGAHPYGRYFEEFEVGDLYKHWPAKTVTEADDHLFCLITMNHHPLHINDVYARASQQGRNVVVGPLVYALALGMSVSDISGKAIANLATEELKHPARSFTGTRSSASPRCSRSAPHSQSPTAGRSRSTRAC